MILKQAELEISSAAQEGLRGAARAERLQVTVAGSLDDFRDVWPRTNDLKGTAAYVFQCADILEAWIDTFGRARATQILLVLISDAAGQPLMALPLGIEKHGGLSTLSFLDAGVSDYNAPVLYPPYQALNNAS